MTGLVEFLGARFDEDEEMAREALASASIYNQRSVKWHWIVSHSAGSMWHPTPASPAYVLADIAAKRAIVYHLEDKARMALEDDEPLSSWNPDIQDAVRVLLILAQPHSAHPDFDPAWRVTP